MPLSITYKTTKPICFPTYQTFHQDFFAASSAIFCAFNSSIAARFFSISFRLISMICAARAIPSLSTRLLYMHAS